MLTGMYDTSGAAYVVASSDLEGHARTIATTSDAWFNQPVLSPDGRRIAVGEMRFPTMLGALDPR